MTATPLADQLRQLASEARSSDARTLLDAAAIAARIARSHAFDHLDDQLAAAEAALDAADLAKAQMVSAWRQRQEAAAETRRQEQQREADRQRLACPGVHAPVRRRDGSTWCLACRQRHPEGVPLHDAAA